MTGSLAIARREFASFFALPIGWVVIALFLTLTGFVFAGWAIVPGEPATMRRFFALSQWAMIFVAPAISMRLFAEEQRTGSIDTLLAAPVSEWAVVFGKHLGATLFLVAMLAPTLLFVGVLGALARPDYGAIALGYFGLVLLGAFYLAVGSLFSCLTASQTVAFLTTLFFVLLLQLASEWLAPMAPTPLDRALYALSLRIRLEDFGKGVLDTAHLVFFVAGSAWFLAVAVVALQSRRWR